MALPVVIPSLAAVRYYTGAPLGETDWIPISQDRVDNFARATGDRNWLHCDPERAARDSPLKCTVIPGFLLLSLVPTLLPRLLVLLGWRTAVNTQAGNCRFPAMVPIGSRVRMSGTIERARVMSGGGCRLFVGIRFEAAGVEEPALTATVSYLYYP